MEHEQNQTQRSTVPNSAFSDEDVATLARLAGVQIYWLTRACKGGTVVAPFRAGTHAPWRPAHSLEDAVELANKAGVFKHLAFSEAVQLMPFTDAVCAVALCSAQQRRDLGKQRSMSSPIDAHSVGGSSANHKVFRFRNGYGVAVAEAGLNKFTASPVRFHADIDDCLPAMDVPGPLPGVHIGACELVDLLCRVEAMPTPSAASVNTDDSVEESTARLARDPRAAEWVRS